MVCDHCKPLNPGESSTVRIVMSIHEARAIAQNGDASELLATISRAVKRADQDDAAAWMRPCAECGRT